MGMNDSRPPKPKRRWYQFRLRTLLVVTLVLAVGLSWIAVKLQQARRQRKAVQAICQLGGAVGYDFDIVGGTYRPRYEEPAGTAWLSRVDLVSDVLAVSLSGPSVHNEDLVHLESLPKLESLHLGGTQVTDAGLKHLKGLTNLKSLTLGGTHVTDGGLVNLKGLTNLDHLELCDTQVTDAGLVHLEGLTNLQLLYLSGTKVTPEGVNELRQALPNCYISYWPLTDPPGSVRTNYHD